MTGAGEIRSELHSAFSNMQDEIQSLRTQLADAEARVAELENERDALRQHCDPYQAFGSGTAILPHKDTE